MDTRLHYGKYHSGIIHAQQLICCGYGQFSQPVSLRVNLTYFCAHSNEGSNIIGEHTTYTKNTPRAPGSGDQGDGITGPYRIPIT